MKILGYIFIGVIIFFVGYSIGSTPTPQQEWDQQNKAQIASDIATAGDKYNQLYNLCEQKYQLALNGNYYDAVRLNGQMDSLVAEINRILNKYNAL